MNKEYRIKKSKEIEKIIKKKHSLINEYYVIYIKKNIETSHFRLGVSVSKKIGNAVVRNTEKRRIREIFRNLKGELKNYDIFVVARENSLKLTFEEKKNAIIDLLKKLNIFLEEEL